MENIVIYKDRRFYSAFPDVERLQNGDLVVVFREAPQRKPFSSHIDSESRIALVRSRDNGKTWEEKTILFEDKNADRGFQDPSATQLNDGTLLVDFFKWNVVKEPPFNHWEEGTFVARSSDNGYTWEEPVEVKVPDLKKIEGLNYKTAASSDSILELPNGELLIPLYGNLEGETRSTFILKSVDKGRTWGDLRVVAFDPFGNLNFDEPVFCCLPSGKVLCMIRVTDFKEEYLYQSESSDNGETWSQPKKTDIWGYPAHLLSLRDGRVLCAYGYRRPPYGVRACLSYDEGKTWDLRNEIILRSDGFHGDLGYPSSVELKDNQVLTVYYFHAEPVNPLYNHYSYYAHAEGTRFIAGTIYSLK